MSSCHLLDVLRYARGAEVPSVLIDPAALFGIAAAPDGNGNQLIYFNDDNDNTVKVLSK